MSTPDAYVIGSGPNGLAAAVTLARAGLKVVVCEASPHIGGGLRSRELTAPGFIHDEFSAVHPFVFASPFFSAWGVRDKVDFAVPDIAFAHPLPHVTLRAHRSLTATLSEFRNLGLRETAERYESIATPLLTNLPSLDPLIMAPPAAARPDLHQASAGAWLAYATARLAAAYSRPNPSPSAYDLLAGCIAHAVSPLNNPVAIAAGLMLTGHAHKGGWPIPLGGAQKIADALHSDLVAHGGRVDRERHITHLGEVAGARLVLADVSPTTMAKLLRSSSGCERYVKSLEAFKYGNGAARVDFALSGPVPWRDRGISAAATVHLGGSAGSINAYERYVAKGHIVGEPYVLVSQPTVFDPSRAPAGGHVVWAYTHVPRGSQVDARDIVRRAIERHAPGFSDLIVGSRGASAVALQQANSNLVGGDIAGGALTMSQIVARPNFGANPWRTPRQGVYLCSASVSPGPGVHGMAGYLAALDALSTEYHLANPLVAPVEPA